MFRRTCRTLSLFAALAAAPFLAAPTAAQTDGGEVEEMVFRTNGEDAGVHRLGHLDSHRFEPRPHVGGTLGGDTHRYWLKFDLSGLPADVDEIRSATLELTAGRKSLLPVGVALGEDAWSAATLDWDHQPAYLPPINEVWYFFQASQTYTWDVTPHVVFDTADGDRTLSLLVMQTPEGTKTGNVWFHSDTLAPSDAYRPALRICYTRGATNEPPEVSVGAPVALTKANHQMLRFSLADLASASDPEDGDLDVNVAGRILSIACNEPADAKGAGKRGEPDHAILDATTFEVRAERAGSGEGRVYTIHFEIVDSAGAATTASAEVHVAHDARR